MGVHKLSMKNNEIRFTVSEDDLKCSIGNMANKLNKFVDTQYKDKLTETMKGIFTDLVNLTESELSNDELVNMINNSILSLSDAILPGLSSVVKDSVSIVRDFIIKLTKGDAKKNLLEQKIIIEQMNHLLEKRNSLFKIAVILNNAMVDTTKEIIDYQSKTAEILAHSLGLGDDIDNINTSDIIENFEDINSQILEMENSITELENKDMNVFESLWDWISNLWGGSRDDKIKGLKEELDNLNALADQYEELAKLLNEIAKQKRIELDEAYKEEELKHKISGEELKVFRDKINYYNELIERSEELGLSELEVLEIQNKLNETVKDRLDFIISHYDKEQELIIKNAKLHGASEEELNKLRMDAIENLIEAKQYEIDTLGSTVDRELELADLEIDRLALQKEINGELHQQGLLYDANLRSVIRSVIESRKLQNGADEDYFASTAYNQLSNLGYSTEDINGLLGTNFSSSDGIDGVGYSPSNNFNMPDFSTVMEDIANTEEPKDMFSSMIREPISELNRIQLDELNELKEHKELLVIQNSMLENIESKIIGYRQDTTNRAYQGNTASDYHRFFNEIEKANRS